MGGTLKSWAVPQGPSLEAGIKRLAVMVEDHPLEYAEFEGTIPKGNYGAGSVMLWDRGWWEPAVAKSPEEMLEKGDFKFILHGEKLRGEFVLAHMKGAKGKGNEWLLIKKKDAEARPGWDVEQYAYSVATGRTQEEIAQELPARGPAARKAREAPEGAVPSPMPSSIQPMLAVSAAEPPAGGGWLYEVKWDGVRALCFLNQGRLRIAGRKGASIERQYPELGVLPQHVEADSAILDGEIAALDENGRPSFERSAAADHGTRRERGGATGAVASGGLLRVRSPVLERIRFARRALERAPEAAGGGGAPRDGGTAFGDF